MPEFRETYQNFSAGELDPDLALRDDRDFYLRGLKAGKNIVPLPSGGFTDRGGFGHADYVRGKLTNITSGDDFATTGPDGGGALASYDLGVARTIHAVDVLDFVTTAPAAIPDSWRVEYSTDNAVWQPFGDNFDANPGVSSRRAALSPGQSVTARYWRVYGLAALASANVSSAGLLFWGVTGALSEARVFGFAYSEETGEADYEMVLTDRNIEVYQDGVRVASAAAPYVSEDIPYVTRAQSLDTLLLFHPNIATHRVFRQRGDAEWDSRPQPFQNIPRVQFEGVSYTNGTNDIQRIYIIGFDNESTQFALRFNGVDTSPVAFSSTPATMVSRLLSALEAHPAIGASNVAVTHVSDGLVFDIEFIAELGQMEQGLMALTYIGPGDGDESFQVIKLQEGERGGEAIMSSARGWPACGAFHQSRLVMGGFRERPEVLVFSALGDYFNLDITFNAADAALQLGIDADQIRGIRQLYSGNHLMMFTDAAEFWIADRVIAKGEPISFAKATGRGIMPGVPVLPADDALLMAQKTGRAVRALSYEEGRQRYVAPNVSRLSSHLIRTPVDWDALPAPDGKGADHVWLANADGSAALFCAMSDEEFLPWVPVETDGAFRSFGVEGGRRLYAVVRRTADGVTTDRLEIYDEAMLYDAGLTVVQSAASSVSGFGHLAGKTVELWLDGRPRGTAAVAGDGTIALPVAAATVMAGLPFTVNTEIMPPVQDVGGTTRGRHSRIHWARLALRDTGAISVGANGETPEPVDLRSFGDTAFDVLEDALFTGAIEVDGMAGYASEPTLRITQAFRAPLHVRGLTLAGRVT